MRDEAEAAAQRIQPAGALPDPMLRVELENINNYGGSGRWNLLPSRVGETKYTVLQPLPAWGKRDLRRGVAEADANQARARAAAAWNELAARIKTAYAQYYLAAGNERLALEIVELIAGLEKIAQSRYSSGLTPQQDAIRAQLEQTAMRSELLMLDSEKRQMRARINALLGRDASAPLADPQVLRPSPAPGAFDAAELVRRALGNNPALAIEHARVSSAEKNVELTLRNRYPDFQVGISPAQMGSRVTTWGVMVEMNIPLQQASRRSQEREAAAMLGAARSRVLALEREVLGEMGMNLAALEAAQRSEALIATRQLPQSELVLRAAAAAYETGKVDFATLLDAQRQIRKARQDQLKARVDAEVRVAEIERIVGEEL
jgi:cobalt-zinc-cadmium efflux system outer membrane protein